MKNARWVSSDFSISRRRFIGAAMAAGGVALLPRAAMSAESLVATTYPGAFEEAMRTVLVNPFIKSHDVDLILTPLLGVDQVAKITAARDNPPYDVVIFDEGPFLKSLSQDIIQPYPAEQSPSFADLLPPYQGEWGPTFTGAPVGIAYNPEMFDSPPTSWEEFWNPKHEGRVGLTGMQSSLGTAFMVEIAKMHGGSESDIEAAFDRIAELLPRVGALAPSPGALATLFQQGEISIAPNYFNNVEAVRAKGAPVEFSVPETGSPFIKASLHIVKNTAARDLAVTYIDTAISKEVQAGLMAEPHNFLPVNSKVQLSDRVEAAFGENTEDLMRSLTFLDWSEINQHRQGWIERFNKVVSQ